LTEAAALATRVRAALAAADIEWAAVPPSFEVTLADRRVVHYRPTFALTGAEVEGRPVLVHVIEPGTPWGALRRLGAFRRQHHARFHLLVVAPNDLTATLLAETYDSLVPATAIDSLPARLGR